MPPVYQIKFRADIDEAFQDPTPWIAGGAIQWLEENLTEEMVAVEYGGGSSTPWFCRRVKELFTYEADTNWAIRLLDYMSDFEEFRRKWRLIHVNCTWHVNPDGSVSAAKGFWRSVVHHLPAADREMMESAFAGMDTPRLPDVVLIDGAIRYRMLEKTIRQMREKPVMIVVVDNANGKAREWVDAIPDTHKRLDFVDTNVANVSRGADSNTTSIFVPR